MGVKASGCLTQWLGIIGELITRGSSLSGIWWTTESNIRPFRAAPDAVLHIRSACSRNRVIFRQNISTQTGDLEVHSLVVWTHHRSKSRNLGITPRSLCGGHPANGGSLNHCDASIALSLRKLSSSRCHAHARTSRDSDSCLIVSCNPSTKVGDLFNPTINASFL